MQTRNILIAIITFSIVMFIILFLSAYYMLDKYKSKKSRALLFNLSFIFMLIALACVIIIDTVYFKIPEAVAK